MAAGLSGEKLQIIHKQKHRLKKRDNTQWPPDVVEKTSQYGSNADEKGKMIPPEDFKCQALNHVKNFYESNAVIHYVCIKGMAGSGDVHCALQQKSSDGDRDLAVRWRIHGVHGCIDYFGSSSGKAMKMNSMNHFKVRNKEIQEKWMLFNGMEVLRQIYAQMDKNNEGGDKQFFSEEGDFTGVSQQSLNREISMLSSACTKEIGTMRKLFCLTMPAGGNSCCRQTSWREHK